MKERGDNMNGENLYFWLKSLFLHNGEISIKEAAHLANVNYENFSRKLKAGTLRTTETITLLNALGYTVYAEKDGKKIEMK